MGAILIQITTRERSKLNNSDTEKGRRRLCRRVPYSTLWNRETNIRLEHISRDWAEVRSLLDCLTQMPARAKASSGERIPGGKPPEGHIWNTNDLHQDLEGRKRRPGGFIFKSLLTSNSLTYYKTDVSRL